MRSSGQAQHDLISTAPPHLRTHEKPNTQPAMGLQGFTARTGVRSVMGGDVEARRTG